MCTVTSYKPNYPPAGGTVAPPSSCELDTTLPLDFCDPVVTTTPEVTTSQPGTMMTDDNNAGVNCGFSILVTFYAFTVYLFTTSTM